MTRKRETGRGKKEDYLELEEEGEEEVLPTVTNHEGPFKYLVHGVHPFEVTPEVHVLELISSLVVGENVSRPVSPTPRVVYGTPPGPPVRSEPKYPVIW